MKKVFLLVFCAAFIISCKKEGTNQQIGGMLHYDNFPDGWGLYYVTDSSEVLILNRKYSTDSLEHEKYKTYVNVHTSLKYVYNGEKGCLYGFGPSCGHRVVDVIEFRKQ